MHSVVATIRDVVQVCIAMIYLWLGNWLVNIDQVILLSMSCNQHPCFDGVGGCVL